MAAQTRRRITDEEATAQAIAVARWTPHGYAARCSGGRFIQYRHVEYIGNVINRAVRKGGGRVIINMPPRHGKSELLSAWTPPWFLDHYRDRNVMLCSYASEIAVDYGRRVRNETLSNPLIGFRLRDDSKAADRWATEEGGGMVAAGVDGAITGRGFHLGLIDDPNKNWQSAMSATVRRQTVEWFKSTFYTRAEPGATIVVLSTRWHPNDLCGWLLEEHEDNWDLVSLPAIAEPGDLLGRQPGEALCPERYDVDDLTRIAASLGPTMAGALYQQKPTGVTSGRVYTGWSDANLDKAAAFNPALPLSITVDWNINPGMHIEIGQSDQRSGRFWVFDEIHGSHLSVNGAAKMLVEYYRRLPTRPVVEIFGDATGVSIVDGSSYCTALKNHLTVNGIPYRDRIPKANPGVLARVLAMNEALTSGHSGEHFLYVHPRCVRLVQDLRTVVADVEGKPDKSNLDLTHASDAVGYWVHYIRPVRLITPATHKGGPIGFARKR